MLWGKVRITVRVNVIELNVVMWDRISSGEKNILIAY